MQEIELLARYNFFIFLFVFFLNCYPQNYFKPSVDSLIKSGVDNLINQNYGQAEENFTKLLDDFPDLPLGNIYLAALEIAEAYDYSEEFNSKLIEQNFEEAERKSDNFSDKYQNNIRSKYFSALIDGYKAYYEALNQNWLSAVSDGYNSIKKFDECLQIDSTFYDAYIAIGTYKYWKSKKIKKISWLPFFDDESSEGIELLLKAKNNFSYNNYLAVYSLQWIFIDKKKFQDAIDISHEVLKKYPKSRFFKWGLARAYEEVNAKKSVEVYFEILDSYKDLKKQNGYNEIVLKHLIAQQYKKLGEYSKALELCDEILNKKNLSTYVYEKLGNRIDRVKALKVDLKKMLTSKE